MPQVPYEKMVQWALENLNASYLKVAPSPLEGVGLFAARHIPKDTVVCRFRYSDQPCVEISKQQVRDSIPPEIFEQLIKIWPVREDSLIVPLNYSNQLHFVNFINHSSEPNLRFDNGRYIARRDIQKDEEITIDYREEEYAPGNLHFEKD